MNRSNASNYTSIQLLQPSRLNEDQALQVGGTKTLADYLVSIRTKKHKQQQLTSKRGRTNNKNDLKPADRNNKRSLSQEIWKNTQSQKRHPSMMNHKRNRSCLALGTITNTKRIKTSKPTTRIPVSTAESSKQRIDETSEGRLQTSICTGNKLQPYFTKESSLRMPSKEQQHDHSVQYQFEFPADLLDDTSMEGAAHPTTTTTDDLLSYSKSSDCCSIISQITQDSSMNENEEESSEDENDDVFNSSEEQGGDEDDETHSSHSSAYHHIAFRMQPQDAKLAEVKEGAQLLLDLLAM